MDSRRHVVVLGGGFGGLKAARSLARDDVRVTLLDRRNHHLFQPLLYQVATAALNPSDIAWPIRRIVRRQANCEVLLAEARAIDPVRKVVVLDAAEIAYDWLVVATGATHAYFGHDEWAPLAPGLKTLEDALEIRRRVLGAFEAAEVEPEPAAREALLTFAVVGAGATGVELAGALAEIARHVLTRDFRRIDPSSARVLLLEAGDRVLPAFRPDLSAAAKERLERMGVEVKLGTPVQAIDPSGLTAAGARIETRTVLWAAGVAASPLARSLGVPLDRQGRVIVEPDLSIPGHRDVFVIGDLAAMTQKDGTRVPGVAPAAMQGGRHVAACIRADLRGHPRAPFRYVDKGSLATIGRAAAVVEIGRIRSEGLFAWLLWLFVHVLTLIGFRSRMLVLLHWAWAYLRNERGARLITGALPAAPEQRIAAPQPEAPRPASGAR